MSTNFAITTNPLQAGLVNEQGAGRVPETHKVTWQVRTPDPQGDYQPPPIIYAYCSGCAKYRSEERTESSKGTAHETALFIHRGDALGEQTRVPPNICEEYLKKFRAWKSR